MEQSKEEKDNMNKYTNKVLDENVRMKKRIKELEKASAELYELVHESDLIENKIRANDLYDIITPKEQGT